MTLALDRPAEPSRPDTSRMEDRRQRTDAMVSMWIG